MTGMEQDAVLGGFQLVIPKIKLDPDIAEAGGFDLEESNITFKRIRC
jgi:hypothetical protein